MPATIEAIARIRRGDIGEVHVARAWMAGGRGGIGRGQPAAVPQSLDYKLWQGPAPHRSYQDNVVHYNWHWFWHWGTGELGNHGIHTLDICRAGLGVDYPTRVSSGGGRYFYEDDQETPDTQVVTFEFAGKVIHWEHRSCQPRGLENRGSGLLFYGDKATLIIGGGDYKIYDLHGKELDGNSGNGGHVPHLENFIAAIREEEELTAEIEEGFKSTMMCHYGNIAWRTSGAIQTDPHTHRIVGNMEAQAMWKREYEPGWEPKGL
jgi:predicted dehydrogenase